MNMMAISPGAVYAEVQGIRHTKIEMNRSVPLQYPHSTLNQGIRHTKIEKAVFPKIPDMEWTPVLEPVRA